MNLRRPLILLATLSALTSCTPVDSTGDLDPDVGGQGGGQPGGGDAAAAGGVVHSGGTVGQPAPTGPTFSEDIAPMIAVHCVSCHTEGGAGPFPLDTYAQVKAMALPALDAITTGRMPPWKPNPDCRPLRDERIMAPDQKALFGAWVEQGLAEGREGVLVRALAPQGEPPVADLIASPLSPYTPDPEKPDDWRCFALDADFERETYIVGTQVLPGAKAIVHHVLVFLATADMLEELEVLEAEDPQPGYTSFGGTGLGNTGPVGAWVPGIQPQVFDPGTAIVVPAGSKLIMQVHYNTLASPPAADLTEYYVTTTETPPEFAIRTQPQVNLDILIPAGDPHSVQVQELNGPARTPLEIIGIGPHMHMLGTQIKVDILRADGTRECLVDVPDWDFSWQGGYRLRAGEPAIVNPGDRFELTCIYDNTPENQMVMNGERLETRDVRWGEKTTDEMCLNYITTITPYSPEGQLACASYPECEMTCEQGDTLCLLDCGSQDLECGQCIIGELFGPMKCGRTECGGDLAAAAGCLQTCIPEALTGGRSMSVCMESTCPMEGDALAVCLDAAIATGACDAGLTACNILR